MSAAPIRVLFIVPNLVFGGAERHVATLLPRMDPARFTPSVICIAEEGELFADLTAAGVDATALGLGGHRNALRALVALVGHMRDKRPEVVVVRGYNAEALGRLAALIAGVKHSIVWVHESSDIAGRSSIHDLADRALIRSTSRYFGVAEAQRPYITGNLHCPEDKVRIIHNGVDPGLFSGEDDRSPLAEFGIGASDAVVCIVAALRPEKDHDTLLRAMAYLLVDVPRAKLLIVGDGPRRAHLEALCDQLGITANVRFAGSRADVPALLRAVDVLVLCSTTECFPMSILEAMACARPVVCTDVGGVSEMVDHGVSGYLVPPRNPGQLAARLGQVLSDPGLARRMGQAGRHRIEAEFTLERSVAETEWAVEEVVRAHTPRRGR